MIRIAQSVVRSEKGEKGGKSETGKDDRAQMTEDGGQKVGWSIRKLRIRKLVKQIKCLPLTVYCLPFTI